jgi:hypothetical protein
MHIVPSGETLYHWASGYYDKIMKAEKNKVPGRDNDEE